MAFAMIALLTGFWGGRRGAADGGFEGPFSRVWEAGLSLNLDDGASLIIATWAVCGDNMARHISAGDRITVYADRDLISYDAWRILDADGAPIYG